MTNTDELSNRKHTLFTSALSGEEEGEVQLLGRSLVQRAQTESYARIVLETLLGREPQSKRTEALVDLALKLLVDHGPYQSGPINTIITARAGKDLVSSLTAGLLTIGSRFGGALNKAANVWFEGVNNRSEAGAIVENFASQKEYLPGIGHKKYRLEIPDPRVKLIKAEGLKLSKHSYLDFALQIEKITTSKKPNLILNVDGCLSAVLLDFLLEEERLTKEEIGQLIEAEFFNALFVLSRSVGLVGHYLDQKRLNEPLFRLDPSEVLTVNSK